MTTRPHGADSFAIHHECGDPACTIPGHLRLVHIEDNRFARAVIEQNAASSAFYAAVAEKHGTAFPIAGPDLDDLDADQVDADMLGLTQCSRCDWNFPDDEINYGCTDVSRACFDCHERDCTDSTCREFDRD